MTFETLSSDARHWAHLMESPSAIARSRPAPTGASHKLTATTFRSAIAAGKPRKSSGGTERFTLARAPITIPSAGLSASRRGLPPPNTTSRSEASALGSTITRTKPTPRSKGRITSTTCRWATDLPHPSA
eukprot:scaffold73464_cov48-Phaeocystis_antarctica.AAC.2